MRSEKPLTEGKVKRIFSVRLSTKWQANRIKGETKFIFKVKIKCFNYFVNLF